VRVATAQAAAAPDLEEAVGAILDRRLRAQSPRPVAVALSGGGDSLALLLAAEAWARRKGRSLIVLTVDHRLRPESAGWTRACGATAGRLGLPFCALAWTGDKPQAGLPAAARAARHALLADAARQAGARVILMGHTADDLLEARLMREAGATTPEPREWAPSPAWPQGRGVFLLRPMLDLRRAAIREWLTARGEAWIDDPANEDQAYARPRARTALALGASSPAAPNAASAKALALACQADDRADFEIARAALRDADPEALGRFVSVACLCAAGTTRPPGREKVRRLSARLAGDGEVAATLAGARIEADAAQVRFRREPGESARGGLAPLALQAGETGVWDGRFEVTARQAVVVRASGRTTLPSAEDDVAIKVRALTHARLLAASGAIEREEA
jgi:tRNA(Ile)-lysidine synthase